MKNFKKLTLFVAIATVATSSMNAGDWSMKMLEAELASVAAQAARYAAADKDVRDKVAAIGQAINAFNNESANKAAQSNPWMSMLSTLPSMTLPTFSMPTLGGVQTSLSDAARLVSTQAQSAGKFVAAQAEAASKTVATHVSNAAEYVSAQAQSAIGKLPTQQAVYEAGVEIAGKKSTKGVAFITAALLLGRIFKSINIAREEALAKGNVAVVKATKPNIVAGFCTKCEYSEHMCNCA